MDPALRRLSDNLGRLVTHHDITGSWPQASVDELTSAGAWEWVIPRAFGGLGLDQHQLTQAYEAVACGCMTTLLILTQRDRACELIAEGENDPLKAECLPRLARGEMLVTVGISQVTTSRQGRRPALSATADGDEFLLTGIMPWVTGAAKAAWIVTAAVVEDGRQLLAVVPTDAPGLTIDKPMELMALQGSLTSEVHCRNVRVPSSRVVRGPAANVLTASMTVRPHVVAAAGVGLAGAMARFVREHVDPSSAALGQLAEDVVHRCAAVRERLYRATSAVAGGGGAEHGGGLGDDVSVDKDDLRIAVNDLLVRVSAAVLIFSKGTGFLRQMPAQRLVREAMFFLVWSASPAVRAGTLSRLLAESPPEIRSLSI
jgi:alkylation response protein AidB-like acyl-CoA dehydrogenase